MHICDRQWQSCVDQARVHLPKITYIELSGRLDRQFAPDAVVTRYDWLCEYDATAATI
jgi:hypothetical protein